MATASRQPSPSQPNNNQSFFHETVRRRLILGMTGATSNLLDDLEARTGFETSELLNVALVLFKSCLDAVEEGKGVGIAVGDQELELEFTGFHKNDPTS